VAGYNNGLAMVDVSGEGKPTSWVDGNAAALAVSPDGRTAVSGGLDCLVRRWDLTGDQLREIAPADGHRGAITAAMYRPGEQTLLTGAQDGTVRPWSLGGPQPKEQSAIPIPTSGRLGLMMPNTGRPLVFNVRTSREAAVWDLTGGKAEAERTFPGHP